MTLEDAILKSLHAHGRPAHAEQLLQTIVPTEGRKPILSDLTQKLDGLAAKGFVERRRTSDRMRGTRSIYAITTDGRARLGL